MGPDLGWHVHLVSRRFDHTTEPAGDVGGNQLAEFVLAGLHAYGFSGVVVERDWGWQVEAPLEGGAFLEVAVFWLGDDEEGNDPELWELAVHAFKRKSQLIFFSRRVDVEVPPEVIQAIRKTLAVEGIQIVRFEQGPA